MHKASAFLKSTVEHYGPKGEAKDVFLEFIKKSTDKCKEAWIKYVSGMLLSTFKKTSDQDDLRTDVIALEELLTSNGISPREELHPALQKQITNAKAYRRIK